MRLLSRAPAAVLLAAALVVVACGSDANPPGLIEPDKTTTETTAPAGLTPSSRPVPSAPSPSAPPSPSTIAVPVAPPPTTDKAGNYPQVFTTAHNGALRAVKVAGSRLLAFDSPTIVVPRPGSSVLYVAERAGIVRSFTVNSDGKAQAADGVVIDVSADTTTEGERGLLGLAFSQDGRTIFVSHTNAKGNTRLESYRMNGEVADAATKKVLLAVEQPFANHNGGNVVLGPDGMLWMGLGDGGAGDDPANRAQDPRNPLGKLLRIDPTARTKPQPWALGLRNPWRFSFDRKTDDLWIGDVGQNATEEVDFLAAGTRSGTNFGWSGFEGSQRYLNKQGRVPKVSVPPVFEMSHKDGWCSVTGGLVYRGSRIPKLEGTYLFGDYCKAGLHGMRLKAGKVSDERALGANIPQLVSINQDNEGEVYLVSLDGGIYALDAG